MSSLHATYLRCIKPYVNDSTIVLEIGPGKGAWTKAFLPASEVYVMDAVSAEHTDFYSYIPKLNKIHYIQILDLNCTELPNNYFNYMFSFGTLCHMSRESIELYARNLFEKLKPGANCFWMISDYKKWNQGVENDNLFLIDRLLRRKIPFRRLLSWMVKKISIYSHENKPIKLVDQDDLPIPGGWNDNDLERTFQLLVKSGYEVIDPDVGTCLRDSIIHFQKPN